MAPITLHMNGKPGELDFIYNGDTYSHQFTFEDELGVPIDKSAKTYMSEVRTVRSSEIVIASFTPVLSGVGNNILTISMAATITATLSPGEYVWDMREIEGAVVETIVTGDVLVVDDVSAVA